MNLVSEWFRSRIYLFSFLKKPLLTLVLEKDRGFLKTLFYFVREVLVWHRLWEQLFIFSSNGWTLSRNALSFLSFFLFCSSAITSNKTLKKEMEGNTVVSIWIKMSLGSTMKNKKYLKDNFLKEIDKMWFFSY